MKVKVVRDDKYYEYFCPEHDSPLGMFHETLLQPGAAFWFYCIQCEQTKYVVSSALKRRTLACEFKDDVGYIEIC